MTNPQPKNLEELLDGFDEAADRSGERVSLDAILDAVGRRSFGPLLLLAGVITILPVIGDIPGVPTLTGVYILLVAGQLLLRRDHFWLPRWLLKRSVSGKKLRKAVHRWLRPVARFVDRLLRSRLEVFTGQAGTYAIAGVCVMIALVMPALEVVPLVANGVGAALVAFGLALIAHDGLLALLGFVCTVGSFGFALYHLL